LNIKCSGPIHISDLDTVVARYFMLMAETMIAAGIPRDKMFTHGGANWGTMPKDVKWNSAESAVIQQVLLSWLLPLDGHDLNHDDFFSCYCFCDSVPAKTFSRHNRAGRSTTPPGTSARLLVRMIVPLK
jgi:hypothetical protein